tara:strand:- start:723 stop:2222 length:1500 start_codon:yes stop_codon:yes gene_type:complete
MISKSNFIIGQQCQRCFWYKYNGFEDISLKDNQAKQRLKDGEEVGRKVKDIFSEGVEIPYLEGNYLEMHKLTIEAIKAGSKVIYEGSFYVDDVFVRVDVMSKSSQGWDIFEVKSSSRLKSQHKEDASIQWFVLNQVKNIVLKDIYVITLNKFFKRKKDLDIEKVFTKHLLTKFVESNQLEVSETLINLKKTAEMESPPKDRSSGHDNKPHKCTLQEHCWPQGREENNSIFKLYRMRSKKKLAMHEEGIDTFEKIKNVSEFSQMQQIQINSTIKNKEYIDKAIIGDFISKVSYPISFFDFETYSEPIPIFYDQKPNERIPFQYSLHIQKRLGDSVDCDGSHHEFLADPQDDPRHKIADSIIKNIPKDGSIITYHQTFEKSVIKDLAEYCPKLSSQLLNLNERILDLKDPFSKGGYYHPDFGGSFSIKKVLPAIFKNNKKLDYKNLNISDGGAASNTYRNLSHISGSELNQVQKDLLKYCWLDTYAMYAIYEELLRIMNKV